MHVGIDLLFLVPGRTGGRETHVRELLPALRTAAPDLRVTTFLNRETAGAGPGWWTEQADRAVVLPRASGSSRARWALGEAVGVARAAARAGVDVLHGPANFVPAAGPFARVLTLHDLLWRVHPELVPAHLRAGTEALVTPGARRAHRVITVSAASREDLVARLRLPADRVAVVPNGIGAVRPGNRPATREALGAGGRPVLLSVAADLPHKNLGVLPEALGRMAADERPLLVLAGTGTDAGRLPGRVRELGCAGEVRLLGPVGQEALEDLYAAADAFITPTRFEGFGLPVLEAMARGLPVAASDLPVLREVGGEDVVAWLRPDDAESVAAAMRRVLAGGPRVERARRSGPGRAAGFTWRSAAEATLAVYREALDARGPSRPRAASR